MVITTAGLSNWPLSGDIVATPSDTWFIHRPLQEKSTLFPMVTQIFQVVLFADEHVHLHKKFWSCVKLWVDHGWECLYLTFDAANVLDLVSSPSLRDFNDQIYIFWHISPRQLLIAPKTIQILEFPVRRLNVERSQLSSQWRMMNFHCMRSALMIIVGCCQTLVSAIYPNTQNPGSKNLMKEWL